MLRKSPFPLVIVASALLLVITPSTATASTRNASVTQASAAPAASDAQLAAEVANDINAERAARGLARLGLDSGASGSAHQVAANNVASGCRACHSSAGRPANAGEMAYSSAPGYASGSATYWWMRSSGHRDILLDADARSLAVGVACGADGHYEAIARVWAVGAGVVSTASSPAVTGRGGSSCSKTNAAPPPLPPPPPTPITVRPAAPYVPRATARLAAPARPVAPAVPIAPATPPASPDRVAALLTALHPLMG
jgi:uncharacterized protein YkwD